MLKIYEDLVDKIGSFPKVRDALNVPHGMFVKISQGFEDPSQEIKDRVAILCSKYSIPCDYICPDSEPVLSEDQRREFIDRLRKFSFCMFAYKRGGNIYYMDPLVRNKNPNELERFALKVRDWATWFEEQSDITLNGRDKYDDSITAERLDDSSILVNNPYIHHYNHLKEIYYRSSYAAAVLLFQIEMLGLKPNDEPQDPFEPLASARNQFEDGFPFFLINNVGYFYTGDYKNIKKVMAEKEEQRKLWELEKEEEWKPKTIPIIPGSSVIYSKLVDALGNLQEVSRKSNLSILSLMAWMSGSNHPYPDEKDKLMTLAKELGIECDPPSFKELCAPPDSIPTPSYKRVHVDHSDPPELWESLPSLPEEEMYTAIRAMTAEEKRKFYSDCDHRFYLFPNYSYMTPEDREIHLDEKKKFHQYDAPNEEERRKRMFGLLMNSFYGGGGRVFEDEERNGLDYDYDGPVPEFIILNQDNPFPDHKAAFGVIHDRGFNGLTVPDEQLGPNRLPEYLKIREFMFDKFQKVDRFKGIPIKNPKYRPTYIQDDMGGYVDYSIDNSVQEF